MVWKVFFPLTHPSFIGVKERVATAILKLGVCSIAVDGWSDYNSMPTLAFTVLVPNGNGYLFRFERLTEREDAQFLQSKVEAVVSDLKTLGLAFFFF